MPYRIGLLALLAALLVACGGSKPVAQSTRQPVASTSATVASVSTPPTTGLRKITLAMSYIPNVQFAPYYVAAQKGYFAAQGLEVNFDYNFENDVVQRVATWPTGQVAFATASGTSVLLARQQGLPVKTIMTLYQAFPIVFFAKHATGLNSAADLAGKTVGIPGNFGESLYGLLAMRYANKFDETTFPVEVIGFTQAQAVLENKVPVAVGYAMNEPVILRQQGEQIDVLRVADVYDLAANGMIASEQLLTTDPALVRGFVTAVIQGLRDTLANPDEAYTISLGFIPEAKLGDSSLQRQVLQASLPYWQSERTKTEGLGYTDVKVWTQTEQFMRAANLLPGAVEVSQAFTNEFLK